jgi:hypothetical protein
MVSCNIGGINSDLLSFFINGLLTNRLANLNTQKPLNPWNYKPWWCQPWSILLTGIMLITGSWALLKTWWLTVLIALPILIWWCYFLLVWPEMMRRSYSWENLPDSGIRSQNSE